MVDLNRATFARADLPNHLREVPWPLRLEIIREAKRLGMTPPEFYRKYRYAMYARTEARQAAMTKVAQASKNTSPTGGHSERKDTYEDNERPEDTR